jgi:glycosyltransferase involved in cell wall biosynthesis
MRFIHPFDAIRAFRPSQELHLDSFTPSGVSSNGHRSSSALKTIMTKVQQNFLNRTGLSLVSRVFTISPEFDAWIKRIAPDLIYFVAADICKLEFACQIKNKYGIRIAFHVFDDFVNSRHQYTWFPKYWRKRLDRSFRQMVDNADLRLAISEVMADEYEERYGHKFHAFHNPVDTAFWTQPLADAKDQEISLQSVRRDDTFTFVYAGKVNRDTAKPLRDMIDICSNIKLQGHKIALKIYSPYASGRIMTYLGHQATGIYQGCVDYAELPTIFNNADALLLPLDFSPQTIQYIRLSMLTKATEYMISGSPIFLYAPGDIAVSQYLINNNAAWHCSSPNDLEESIQSFIQDSELRCRIAKRAKKLAEEKHTQPIVTARLKEMIMEVCSN